MIDKRNLKSLRTFATCLLIANILGNFIYFLNYKGYYFPLLDGITVDTLNNFSSFTLIALGIGAFFNRRTPINDEIKTRLNLKLKPMLLSNIIFIAYILISALVFKNMSLLISSAIMELIYICIIIYTKSILCLSYTDHRLRWQQAMSGVNDDINDSNIFWRFKLWFTPFERVPFKDRYFSKYSLFYAVLCTIFMWNLIFTSIFIWVFIFVAIRTFIAFIEYIFGLYTSLTGICTGLDELTTRSNTRYWRIYVTDFKNKREIVYESYKPPYFDKNDNVKVIHGIFSKKVIRANGMKVINN